MAAMGRGAAGGGFLVQRFSWPLTSGLRGFRLTLRDGQGHQLSRRLVHHLYLLNFSRRELLYPMVQRVLGVGRETPDYSLPSGVTVPMEQGSVAGLFVMWGNEAGGEITDVTVELRVRWTPANQVPPPIIALPFFADVYPNFGGEWAFAIPPGGGTRARAFDWPMPGRLLIVGGHLHEHGVSLELQDAQTGSTIALLRAKRDPEGHVVSIGRKAFAVNGAGRRVAAGAPLRLMATYGNPTPDTLTGVMGTMGGLFSPADLRHWPPVDPADPDYRIDLAAMTAPPPGSGPPITSRCGPETRLRIPH